jgi:hypothetical protein
MAAFYDLAPLQDQGLSRMARISVGDLSRRTERRDIRCFEGSNVERSRFDRFSSHYLKIFRPRCSGESGGYRHPPAQPISRYSLTNLRRPRLVALSSSLGFLRFVALPIRKTGGP